MTRDKVYLNNNSPNKKVFARRIEEGCKCRYCGERNRNKMFCYNPTATLYSKEVCNHCYQTQIRGKIPIKLTYINDVIFSAERSVIK